MSQFPENPVVTNLIISLTLSTQNTTPPSLQQPMSPVMPNPSLSKKADLGLLRQPIMGFLVLAQISPCSQGLQIVLVSGLTTYIGLQIHELSSDVRRVPHLKHTQLVISEVLHITDMIFFKLLQNLLSTSRITFNSTPGYISPSPAYSAGPALITLTSV